MKKTKTIFTVLLILILAACKTTPKSKAKVTLNGMIYDTQNKPVVNYTILIDGLYKCQSDISGRFILKDISKGEHIISGYGDRYLDIYEQTVIYDKAQILYIRVPSVETKLKEAYSYLEQEHLEKSEECIKEILASNEDNTDALFFMGVIKLRQGSKEESLVYLEKLKEKKEVSKYVQELEKIIAEN